MQITKKMARKLSDTNLEMAASIALALFNQSPGESKVRKLLRKDLKTLLAELEKRQALLV